MLGTFLLYNSILVFSTLFVWLSEKTKEKNIRFLLLFIAFLIVFIPAAIRYNIGIDYWSYIEMFYVLKEGGETHGEIGYQYLNKLIAFFGLDAEWLVFFVSLLTYYFIFKSYPKENAWIINFLFISTFYLYTYSNFRTGIVLAVIFYATMRYLEKKNLFCFFSCVFISLLFHKTAFLFLLIPVFYSSFLTKFISSRYVLFLVFIFLLMSFLFKYELITFIVNSSITEYLGYSYYVDSELFFSKTEFNSGFGVIARIAPLVVFVCISAGLAKNNRKIAFGINLSLFYIWLVILTSAISIFSRIETLFYMVYMIVGYLSCMYLLKLKKQVFLVFLIFIWSLLFLRSIHTSQSNLCSGMRISPYVSIFNKHDDNSLRVPRVVCEYW